MTKRKFISIINRFNDATHKEHDAYMRRGCGCKMDDKQQQMAHVLEIARCDLSFAIDMIPTPENDPTKRRLRHGIEMITNVLEDHDYWLALQERWIKENEV